ncbi:MAG: archaeosortase/exosortase family protein, partial [Thermodesulfobacteriota bacterium]
MKSAIIVACLVLLYFRILQGLVSDWIHMPDFSHGFLIPIVSLYFVYERRKELSALSPSAAWGGLGLI